MLVRVSAPFLCVVALAEINEYFLHESNLNIYVTIVGPTRGT